MLRTEKNEFLILFSCLFLGSKVEGKAQRSRRKWWQNRVYYRLGRTMRGRLLHKRDHLILLDDRSSSKPRHIGGGGGEEREGGGGLAMMMRERYTMKVQ